MIKKMTLEDLQTLLGWAAEEGWNPGLDDAEAFLAADPEGFLMALKDKEPAAGISVIKQDNAHGFLGLYICKPMFRGQGVGWATWQAGMHYLDGMTIGLDGVVEQQDNYRKSGFELAYRNIRYAGVPSGLSTIRTGHRSVRAEDLDPIAALDLQVHGVDRRQFLRAWLTDTEHRHSIVGVQGDQITGFGTIRACQQGYKIGPLIAQTASAAKVMLSCLIARCGAEELILDVPEPNEAALELAKSLGLKPVFETARMYRGTPPDYDLRRLFGVTTFELG